MSAPQRLTRLSLSILLLAALLLTHTQYSWAQTDDSRPANDPFQTVQDSRQALSPRIVANKQQDYSLPADTPSTRLSSNSTRVQPCAYAMDN